jgi:hypothetical protein
MAFVTSATVTRDSLEICEEELEFFRYAENGDIDAALRNPTRSGKRCRNRPIQEVDGSD